MRLVFSETMDQATVSVGGATAAIRVLDADATVYQSGVLTWPASGIAEVALGTAADAWWRDRPVRLQVGPPAADVEGNAMAATFETVFFPGSGDLSGGFLFGEAYDDAERPSARRRRGAALRRRRRAARRGAGGAGGDAGGRRHHRRPRQVRAHRRRAGGALHARRRQG